MPPLNAKNFAILGYLVFMGKAFKMPTKADYKAPRICSSTSLTPCPQRITSRSPPT